MEHAQNGDFKPEKSRNPEAREEAGHGHVNCQELVTTAFWPLIDDLCRSCPCFVAKTLKHALEMLQRVARRVEEIICFRVSWL